MITVKALNPFKTLYDLPTGTNTVICIGGRGGSKTYEVSKFICFSATVRRKRCLILRDEQSKIRQSILNEILLRYDTANEYGGLDRFYEKQETGIKDRTNSNDVVFTSGFRMSSNERKAGLKSVSDVDIAVIEEAEDIRDASKYQSFSDSIRKEGYLIIIILNTPDINHWIIERYFNTEPVYDAFGEVVEGYFNIAPKKLPGFVCIQTSYKDNPYLPEQKASEYEGYGNPLHHLYDLHHFYTDIKGYASTGRRGQILTKVKPIKLAEYLALPFKEYFGQDFGTSSPAGMVGVKFDKNNCYFRQINYEPKDTLGLAKMYASMGFGPANKIVADSAEPKTIERLVSGWKETELTANDFALYPQLKKGFFIVPAVKGPGSIKTGIGLMKSMELHCVEESKEFWKEIRSWIYATDMSGMATDEPEDKFNHLIDPLRYVITDYKGLSKNFSQKGYFR